MASEEHPKGEVSAFRDIIESAVNRLLIEHDASRSLIKNAVSGVVTRPRRSETIGKLMGALAKAQASFGPVLKNQANKHLNTRYADMESVVNATRPSLNANGLAITETTEFIGDELYAIALLGHESGEWVEAICPVHFIDSTNNKGYKTLNSMQEFGSSHAYARRYVWQMVTGVVSEDDDGQGAEHNNNRQQFRGQSDRPGPRRPSQDQRPRQPERQRAEQKPDPVNTPTPDGPPAWAKGLTPSAIAQVTRDYYTLHQDAVTAALNAIGIDPDPSVSLGSTVNQAMVNRIIEAALGDTDVEHIETGPLCDRITELDLGKVLADFPRG